jgi:probable F420-dependent oxidoreductase
MARVVRRADELGIYGLSFSEHLFSPTGGDESTIGTSWPDNIVLAANLAAQTEQIHFVFFALVVTYRQPVLLAKQIATLDVVSKGRTVFALASGWMEPEFDAVGIPFDERSARTDESIGAMKELWTSESPKFDGEHFSFSNLVFAPRPVQQPHPPILVAGSGPRPLRRVLELADGWAPMLGDLDSLRTDIAWLKKQLGARGRDPELLRVMHNVVLEPDDLVTNAFSHSSQDGSTEMTSVSGTGDWTEDAVELIREYAAVGVTDLLVIVNWDTPDDYIAKLERLAREVVPNV